MASVKVGLTERLASRYIILSFRCRIGVTVSPESADWVIREAFTEPLAFWFAERWVMGLVPTHALCCEGFLKRGLELAGRPKTGVGGAGMRRETGQW